MTLETRIRKTQHNGLTATTRVELDIDGKRAQLSFETSKSNYPKGTITTNATVGFISADGRGVIHRLGFGGLEGDFSAELARTTARATEKAITTQHAQALTQYDATVERVHAYYAAKAQLKAEA